MARGGKREGSGRKPKADEEKLTLMMDRILSPDEFWKMVAAMAVTGEVQAVRIWAAYRYGQPKQSMDITSDGDKITDINIKIIQPDGA